MENKNKWGLFVGNIKVIEYTDEEYAQALVELATAYRETGVKHQLKLV